MLDLLEGGKLKERLYKHQVDKLAQKWRLKRMLLADQIPLKRFVFTEFMNIWKLITFLSVT